MDPHKLCRLGGFWLVAALSASVVDGRTFHVKRTGAAIKAEIADAGPGSLTLQGSEKPWRTAVEVFSAPDQEYIRKWMRENRGIYDWPSSRGRWFDGATEEKLGGESPSVRWRAKVGAGDAAVVVSDAVAVTTGIRDGRMEVVSLGLEKGDELWRKSYKVTGAGARATTTPMIDLVNQRVISVGPGGRIDAWKLGDGDNLWATPLKSRYSMSTLPVGGRFGSPVVEGEQVLMEIGGPACSLVSLATTNGMENWRIGKHQSQGATPVIAEIGGKRTTICLNQYGIVGRAAKAGTMSWDQAWPGADQASPLAFEENFVFVTSGSKCAVYQIDGRRTNPVWENSVLCSEFVTPVHHKGFLYGFNGDALTCVNAKSGKVAWSKKDFGGGNLIRAAERLLIQTRTSGELVIADADPASYKERSRTKVFEGESRTTPVLATGQIYCRSSAGDVTCLAVKSEK